MYHFRVINFDVEEGPDLKIYNKVPRLPRSFLNETIRLITYKFLFVPYLRIVYEVKPYIGGKSRLFSYPLLLLHNNPMAETVANILTLFFS